MSLCEQTEESSTCHRLPTLIFQKTNTDCGIACLAMAANLDYGSAYYLFGFLNIEKKYKHKTTYRSNFKEVRNALAALHIDSKLRHFSSWSDIRTNSVVKVDNGHTRSWHWVYATRTAQGSLLVLDPLGKYYAQGCPDLHPLDTWQPQGCFIELLG